MCYNSNWIYSKFQVKLYFMGTKISQALFCTYGPQRSGL